MWRLSWGSNAHLFPGDSTLCWVPEMSVIKEDTDPIPPDLLASARGSTTSHCEGDWDSVTFLSGTSATYSGRNMPAVTALTFAFATSAKTTYFLRNSFLGKLFKNQTKKT